MGRQHLGGSRSGVDSRPSGLLEWEPHCLFGIPRKSAGGAGLPPARAPPPVFAPLQLPTRTGGGYTGQNHSTTRGSTAQGSNSPRFHRLANW